MSMLKTLVTLKKIMMYFKIAASLLIVCGVIILATFGGVCGLLLASGFEFRDAADPGEPLCTFQTDEVVCTFAGRYPVEPGGPEKPAFVCWLDDEVETPKDVEEPL